MFSRAPLWLSTGLDMCDGECCTVETASLTDCQSKHRAATTTHSGYLASYMSSGSVGIGTPSCPWYISAQRGQRLNLTLFNFISPTLATPGESAAKVVETCYHVGVVRDGPDRRQGVTDQLSLLPSAGRTTVHADGSVTACPSQSRQRTILISSGQFILLSSAGRKTVATDGRV